MLGSILFMTGLKLAGSHLDQGRKSHESTVPLVTAELSKWNVDIRFGVGLLLQFLLIRKTKRV